ncbi:hypothetical protein LCGC14_2692420, partial [marine sediment metagenome]
LFNRIETGIVVKNYIGANFVDFYDFYEHWSAYDLEHAIRNEMPDGPWVTGSYMVRSMDGHDKLHGIILALDEIQMVMSELLIWFNAVPPWLRYLEQATHVLTSLPMIGRFVAYEIVTDLRHTHLLKQSRDILTWANPGPGARRGINRIFGHSLKALVSDEYANECMLDLLEESYDLCAKWGWDDFEMRDIEHCLCETDKYLRVKNGEGRPRAKNKWRNSFNG